MDHQLFDKYLGTYAHMRTAMRMDGLMTGDPVWKIVFFYELHDVVKK